MQAAAITDAVVRLCIDANCRLGDDALAALRIATEREESPVGQDILRQLVENAEIAARDEVPICQDTGLATFFVELGQDVHISGSTLIDAINEGVRRGYREGYLRKSVVDDPLLRRNTGDNTPAVVHVTPVAGDGLKINFAAKGGGSENMSRLAMLKPSEGIEGVKRFVVQAVAEAGANPCPPVVVGVGIGGSFEQCALIAKRALLRRLGDPSPLPHLAELERELFELVNNLGVGPQGLGGRVTAFAVHVEALPTHIASLPVAVALNCHAYRHGSIEL